MSGPLVVSQGWIGPDPGGWRRLPTPWSLTDVAAFAAMGPAPTVYIVDTVRMASIQDPDGTDGITLTPSAGEPETPWRWRAQTASGYEVSIVFLELADRTGGAAGPWQGLTAREMADAFAAFRRLVGEPWADGIGKTAERLILSTHPRKKGGTLLDASPDVPEVLRDNTLELPYHSWCRRPVEAAAFVHAFDANAQYLGAWGTVELGHGRPTHRQWSGDWFDKNLPGVWRVANAGELPNPDLSLPAPWLPGREWFTTPTIARMIEVLEPIGVVPDITEAWTWPRHSRFLRPASEILRDARKAALEEVTRQRATLRQAEGDDVDAAARRIAVASTVADAVKALYAVQTGRFGMAGRDQRSGWARPDWACMIRAQARVNLHRRLSRLTAAPFALATDGLLFVSDEPDGLEFADSIGLPIGNGLGQFKYDATTPRGVVDQVLEEHQGPRVVGAMFEAMKRHG